MKSKSKSGLSMQEWTLSKESSDDRATKDKAKKLYSFIKLAVKKAKDLPRDAKDQYIKNFDSNYKAYGLSFEKVVTLSQMKHKDALYPLARRVIDIGRFHAALAASTKLSDVVANSNLEQSKRNIFDRFDAAVEQHALNTGHQVEKMSGVYLGKKADITAERAKKSITKNVGGFQKRLFYGTKLGELATRDDDNLFNLGETNPNILFGNFTDQFNKTPG